MLDHPRSVPKPTIYKHSFYKHSPLTFVLFGLLSLVITTTALFSMPTQAAKDTTFVPDYRWPVDVSRHLSGTFGETRSAHFHSGLDIKTWGREGYPVFATEKGYISRMAISARGYGKVLYVTHPNGYTSVYAHLQRFSPELQAYIDSIRVAQGYRFEIDIDLGYAANTHQGSRSNPRFPVQRGQRIAYTGSTGIGPPHLHFELRNPQERALNALEFGIQVKDRVPPTIRSLMVVPLAANSRVHGQTQRKVFQAIAKGETDNASVNFGRIAVQGPIGVAFDIFDGADEVNNKYAFYQAWLIDHGPENNDETHATSPDTSPDNLPDTSTKTSPDTLVHQRIDALDFDNGGAMFFDRLAAPNSKRRSFQAFFPQDGPIIPFYKIMKAGPGVGLALDASTSSARRYELIVQDYAGNESRASYLLEVDAEHHAQDETVHHYATKIHPSDWTWKTNWVAVNDSLSWSLDPSHTEWPQAPFIQANDHRSNEVQSSKGHWFQDGVLHTITRLLPDSNQRIKTEDRRIHWFAQEGSFPDTLSLGMFHDQIQPPDSAGHPIPLLGILPLPLPQQKSITVEWFVGDYLKGYKNKDGQLPSQLGLFRFNPEDQSYSRVASTLHGGMIRAHISGSGLFTLWADSLPPRAFNVAIQPTVFGTTGVSLRFEEEHSGIETSQTTILVNGQRGIIEFDYEDDSMLYYRPNWTANKGDTLEIEYQLVDGSGNRIQERITRVFR